VTRADAQRLVATLAAAYPRTPLPPETIKVYVSAISTLAADETENAIRRLIFLRRFLPSIAEVVCAVVEARLGLPSPVEAWRHVNESSVGLTDPERAAMRHVGGAYAIRTTDRPDVVRAQFLRAYEQERDRVVADAVEGLAVTTEAIEGRVRERAALPQETGS
jgi:hypothetical protein